MLFFLEYYVVHFGRHPLSLMKQRSNARNMPGISHPTAKLGVLCRGCRGTRANKGTGQLCPSCLTVGGTSAWGHQAASGALFPRPSCAESHARAEHASATPLGFR